MRISDWSSDVCSSDLLPNGGWGFAHTAAEAKEMGFWAFHVDTLGWSVALGLIFVLLFRMAAKKATSGQPGALQNFVEVLVEFVDGSVKDSLHGRRRSEERRGGKEWVRTCRSRGATCH